TVRAALRRGPCAFEVLPRPGGRGLRPDRAPGGMARGGEGGRGSGPAGGSRGAAPPPRDQAEGWRPEEMEGQGGLQAREEGPRPAVRGAGEGGGPDRGLPREGAPLLAQRLRGLRRGGVPRARMAHLPGLPDRVPRPPPPRPRGARLLPAPLQARP